jgi:cell wall-associated NlpC family hydrolase
MKGTLQNPVDRSRVGRDPLSPPGKSNRTRWVGSSSFLALLLTSALLPTAAPAQELPSFKSIVKNTVNKIPGLGSGEAQADKLPEKVEAVAKEEKSSFEFGAEYLLALRAATSVWTGPVQQALSFLGTPYRMGGTSRQGIDCSGLMGFIFNNEGFSLPRTAAQQFQIGTPVEIDNLRAGDLVFFANTYKRGISHVGLYIGEGKFVHAENRRRGVVITSLQDGYYRAHFAGGRRLIRTPGDDLAVAASELRTAPSPAVESESLAEAAPRAASTTIH